KYKLDVSGLKIKSFLDIDFKDSISFNLHDVIYINQGDIVNYFEKNSLVDLIRESGKNDDYKIALDFFKVEKSNLNQLIETLVELYSELIDNLNSNFSLYNKDIESIFDDSYFFKPIDQITDKEISFSNSSIILETLLDNIEKFRNNENFNLDADELALTNKFAELVKYKKADFSTLQSLYHNRVELKIGRAHV